MAAFAIVAALAVAPCTGLTFSGTPEAAEPKHSAGLQSNASRARRTLVVCLQASGCSVFVKLLGQHEGTVVIQDAHIYAPAPSFPMPEHFAPRDDLDHIVLKVSLQGDDVHPRPIIRLRKIQERFQPHKTILAMRSPVENYEKLMEHTIGAPDFVDTRCAVIPPVELQGNASQTYGNRCGSPLGKLRSLDKLWRRYKKDPPGLFDAVVLYEDLVGDASRRENVVSAMNSIGFPLNYSHFDMARSSEEVLSRAKAALVKVPRFFKWGTGDVLDGPIRLRSQAQKFAKESVQLVSENVPTLFNESWDAMRSHATPLDADA